MPVIRLYPHGLTAGIPPMNNDHTRGQRGETSGWSAGATRRNVQFLRSVIEDSIDGVGYAFTLTLKDCPPTSDDWHRCRQSFLKRLERLDMIRFHWVTEWQARGVPHLHGVAFFPPTPPKNRPHSVVPSDIVDAWLSVAEAYGAGPKGQMAVLVSGLLGWFQYVSKHAARGVKHYQRDSANIPIGWKKTGRVWGYGGSWDLREALQVNLQARYPGERPGGECGDGGYYAFRRLVRSWRIADARLSGNVYRLKTARQMLRCHEKALSSVRGVSEWIPEPLAVAFIASLAARGYAVSA